MERGTDPDTSASQDLIRSYLGTFVLAEPKKTVDHRVDTAIDEAVQVLSRPVRMIGRPLLRFVAHVPDTIVFAEEGPALVITFSKKIVLRGQLGLTSPHQRMPGGQSGDVTHRVVNGLLETVIDAGASGVVTNRYELRGDELVGRVEMSTPHLPTSIHYHALLRRAPR